jgi:hypothetical protein
VKGDHLASQAAGHFNENTKYKSSHSEKLNKNRFSPLLKPLFYKWKSQDMQAEPKISPSYVLI